MRVVTSSGRVSPDVALPSHLHLENVRRFGARFPEARLREPPVIRSADLDLVADPSGRTRVWLALESLQVTGSFKVRGALNALAAVTAAHGPNVPVITASAGNHGGGVAYAAAILGHPATIVVPQGTPANKRAKISAYGAEIIYGPTTHYDDAQALAQHLAKSRRWPFISPYDDLEVIAGNGGSLGFEIVRAMGGVPEMVLAPFGGGGLSTGLACALALESGEPFDQVRRVWGVQSEASPAMARSLESGHAVERLSAPDFTLAEGLEGGISAAAYARARGAIAGVIVVTENVIDLALRYLYRECGLVVEGSAAIALVPVLLGLPPEACGGDLCVVLTGRNIDRDRWEKIMAAPNA